MPVDPTDYDDAIAAVRALTGIAEADLADATIRTLIAAGERWTTGATRPQPEPGESGPTCTRHALPGGPWLADVTIRTAAGATVTPAAVDLTAGVAYLSTSTLSPLTATGTTYDPHDAAALACDAMAATAAGSGSFTTAAGESWQGASTATGWSTQAAEHRRRRRPGSAQVGRSDNSR